VASLATEVREARHGGLADVLGKQPVLDAEALFRHSLGAGRRERAAEWAVQAAERAAEMLAFARAAELYGRALEFKEWDEARMASLKIARAEALVSAGRGAEAAPVFLSAPTGRGAVPDHRPHGRRQRRHPRGAGGHRTQVS